MEPVTITLVIQGNLKYPFDLEYIQKWDSKIFKIVGTERVESLPNSGFVPSGYSDQELVAIFTPSGRSDLTLAIVGAQLELNFYARMPPTGVVVLSLFEMGDILNRENHTVETFVLRCLYALVLAYVECGRSLSLTRALQLHHDEPRGCLYDFNQAKVETVRSLDRPKLRADCLARLGHRQIDASFVPALIEELKRIRKGRYYRILDWARKNPSRPFCWRHCGWLSLTWPLTWLMTCARLSLAPRLTIRLPTQAHNRRQIRTPAIQSIEVGAI
jgi:hypothetical protein